MNISDTYSHIKKKAASEPGLTCLKQSVVAMIVTKENVEIFGTNNIQNKIDVCPRIEQNLKTGEGYHLCKDICNQNSHAEVTAINNAKLKNINLLGSSLFLIGHTYCCDNCLSVMKENGVSKVYVINENDIIKKYDIQGLKQA